MPTNAKAANLRRRFGLAAVDAPPVIFNRTPSGKVWGGVNGLAAPVASSAPTAKPTPTPAAAAVDARTSVEPKLPRDEAHRAFVEWLDRAYPGMVPALLEALGVESIIARDGGLGQTEEKSLVERLLDAATAVVPAYLQYEQQKDILEVQLDRARAGLPPLDAGAYAASMQIGLDRETIQRLADEAGARAAATAGAFASSPLPWVILGGGALLIWSLSQKGGRRRARR
jgi:hypothetical protein